MLSGLSKRFSQSRRSFTVRRVDSSPGTERLREHIADHSTVVWNEQLLILTTSDFAGSRKLNGSTGSARSVSRAQLTEEITTLQLRSPNSEICRHRAGRSVLHVSVTWVGSLRFAVGGLLESHREGSFGELTVKNLVHQSRVIDYGLHQSRYLTSGASRETMQLLN